METAKEVGGDFYDFYFIDDDHFAMVMADVSDKGIPAAMFMIRAKAAIKNRAKKGGTPAQILYDVNNSLCKHNDAKLFVTVWLAIVELSTGKVLEANAGHEHPALCRDGEYRLVKYPHSPPLSTLPGLPFNDREFTLQPGDKIFVYTDGVTDAENSSDERFGEAGLTNVLKTAEEYDSEATVNAVRDAIKTYASGKAQFDDITMLAFTYFGKMQDA